MECPLCGKNTLEIDDRIKDNWCVFYCENPECESNVFNTQIEGDIDGDEFIYTSLAK